MTSECGNNCSVQSGWLRPLAITAKAVNVFTGALLPSSAGSEIM
jgi:hypothetical protein